MRTYAIQPPVLRHQLFFARDGHLLVTGSGLFTYLDTVGDAPPRLLDNFEGGHACAVIGGRCLVHARHFNVCVHEIGVNLVINRQLETVAEHLTAPLKGDSFYLAAVDEQGNVVVWDLN